MTSFNFFGVVDKNLRWLLAFFLSAILLTCERNAPLSTEQEIDIEFLSKTDILKKFAPVIYFHPDEEFWPSSVEWAFPFYKRVLIDGKYWLVTRQPLEFVCTHGADPLMASGYVVTQEFFYGCIEQSNIYAYWVDKTPFIDLVYYVFYPYNQAKFIEDIYFGPFPIAVERRFFNHVGDWEHIAIRLRKSNLQNPEKILLSAHHFTNIYNWSEIEKYQNTHPVVYVALGSHGFWKNPGNHHYDNIELPGPFTGKPFEGPIELYDKCSKGLLWYSYDKIKMFDFNNKRSLDGSTWPRWMSDDFSNRGTGDPSDPASGAIYRWGNPKTFQFKIGYGTIVLDPDLWTIVAGPTGPISKPIFYSDEL